MVLEPGYGRSAASCRRWQASPGGRDPVVGGWREVDRCGAHLLSGPAWRNAGPDSAEPRNPRDHPGDASGRRLRLQAATTHSSPGRRADQRCRVARPFIRPGASLRRVRPEPRLDVPHIGHSGSEGSGARVLPHANSLRLQWQPVPAMAHIVTRMPSSAWRPVRWSLVPEPDGDGLPPREAVPTLRCSPLASTIVDEQ